MCYTVIRFTEKSKADNFRFPAGLFPAEGDDVSLDFKMREPDGKFQRAVKEFSLYI